MRTLKTITLADAKKALNAMEKKAEELSIDVSFCIIDGTNNILILERMDDCKILSINLAKVKALTAFRLRDLSGNAGKITREMNVELSYWAGECETGFGGGIPIYSDKNDILPVGAIGVSGGTQEEDIEIALVGIEAMESMTKK